MSAPDARIEIFYSDAWHDITVDYDSLTAITTTYGQQADHSEAVPTDLQVPLENPAVRYSPKDPNSELFELIGTGTPLRLRIGDSQAGLALPGRDESYASTPDTAALDVTGDIDIRVDVTPATWRPTAGEGTLMHLTAKWWFVGADQRSWAFSFLEDGRLELRWTTDGTNGTVVTAQSTAAIPAATGRLALRATLDVDNGGGGHTVTFYTAPEIGGSWTQLGAAVVTAGTTSIFSSSAGLTVGSVHGGTSFNPAESFRGLVHAFELRNSIGGTVVAEPDFRVLDFDATSFTDDAGREWTVHGQAYIGDPSIRAAGTITRFAPTWNRTTRDARMKLTAAGPLANWGKGTDPLRSSLFRDLSTKDSVVAYWPMEDTAGATSFASGIAGHPPMAFVGAVNLGSYSGFAASEAIPTFTAPGAGLASYAYGTVPTYTPLADQRVIALVHVPDSGVPTSERALLTVRATGTATRWVVGVTPAGDLRVTAFDRDEVSVLDSGTIAFAMNGRHVLLSLLLQQVGANINWQVSTFDVTGATGASGGTLASRTYGRIAALQPGPSFDLGGTAIAHTAIFNGDVNAIWDVAAQSLVAWAGETAPERIERLAREAGIPLRLIGDPADGELVGAQKVSALLTLIDDAAKADMGLLGERRDYPSLQYRTRASLYNQDPALELDASTGVITNPFDPALDTRDTASEFTVRRVDGSSYRAVDDTATVYSPDGVTLNLFSDEQLRDQAAWRLHLGMVDEHRVASLTIEMHHNPDLVQSILELEVGGLIRIANPPPGLPPGPLDLIALGWSDSITDEKWYVTINCAPGTPWTVAEVSDGADEQRVDTDGSVLDAAFVSGTDTTMRVASIAGPKWTEDPSEFPFDIQTGGAVLTATAAQTTEHAPNPTFETDVAGWEPLGGTITRSTAQKHSGVASLLLTPDGVTAVVRARTDGVVRVYEGREYTFGVWVYSTAGYTVDTSVRFFSDDVGAGSVVEFEMWTNQAIPAGVWTLLSATRTAPVGARSAELNVNQRTTPPAGALLYVDDVTFTGPVQTITVEQTPVNGIAKTVALGADVRLANPAIIGL